MAGSGHTVICGLERVSLRVARALLELGERVTIVAETPEQALLREARRAGTRVVQGRTADLRLIRGLGLESARCLVLTEDADLRNLHAALAAREVNREIRVVLRMFNAELADRATRLLANSRMVSTSAEAAPYFAAAALGVATAPTRLAWGRHLVIGERDQPPSAIDLGGGEHLRPIEPEPLQRRRTWRLLAYRRAVRAFFDRRLAVMASALALLIAVSVAVFHSARGLGLTWIDALTFTVSTAYGNSDLRGAEDWVKLYGVGFTFAATLGLALLFGLAADAIIGVRLLEALGVPRGRLRNHVVVLGLGNVGYRTVRHLLETGVEVAAADSRPNGRFVAIARRLGVPVLIGDGHYTDSLRALSVERARAVVAASPDDLVNLEAALAARELNPEARVVVRLFDQELAERAEQQLHITACHSVSALATPAFVAAALGDGVLSIVERGDRTWLLAEARVAAGSALEGAAVADLEATRDLRVLAVRGGFGERWRPDGTERLEGGSALLVACSRAAWERLRTRAAGEATAGVC